MPPSPPSASVDEGSNADASHYPAAKQRRSTPSNDDVEDDDDDDDRPDNRASSSSSPSSSQYHYHAIGIGRQQRQRQQFSGIDSPEDEKKSASPASASNQHGQSSHQASQQQRQQQQQQQQQFRQWASMSIDRTRMRQPHNNNNEQNNGVVPTIDGGPTINGGPIDGQRSSKLLDHRVVVHSNSSPSSKNSIDNDNANANATNNQNNQSTNKQTNPKSPTADERSSISSFRRTAKHQQQPQQPQPPPSPQPQPDHAASLSNHFMSDPSVSEEEESHNAEIGSSAADHAKKLMYRQKLREFDAALSAGDNTSLSSSNMSPTPQRFRIQFEGGLGSGSGGGVVVVGAGGERSKSSAGGGAANANNATANNNNNNRGAAAATAASRAANSASGTAASNAEQLRSSGEHLRSHMGKMRNKLKAAARSSLNSMMTRSEGGHDGGGGDRRSNHHRRHPNGNNNDTSRNNECGVPLAERDGGGNDDFLLRAALMAPSAGGGTPPATIARRNRSANETSRSGPFDFDDSRIFSDDVPPLPDLDGASSVDVDDDHDDYDYDDDDEQLDGLSGSADGTADSVRGLSITQEQQQSGGESSCSALHGGSDATASAMSNSGRRQSPIVAGSYRPGGIPGGANGDTDGGGSPPKKQFRNNESSAKRFNPNGTGGDNGNGNDVGGDTSQPLPEADQKRASNPRQQNQQQHQQQQQPQHRRQLSPHRRMRSVGDGVAATIMNSGREDWIGMNLDNIPLPEKPGFGPGDSIAGSLAGDTVTDDDGSAPLLLLAASSASGKEGCCLSTSIGKDSAWSGASNNESGSSAALFGSYGMMLSSRSDSNSIGRSNSQGHSIPWDRSDSNSRSAPWDGYSADASAEMTQRGGAGRDSHHHHPPPMMMGPPNADRQGPQQVSVPRVNSMLSADTFDFSDSANGSATQMINQSASYDPPRANGGLATEEQTNHSPPSLNRSSSFDPNQNREYAGGMNNNNNQPPPNHHHHQHGGNHTRYYSYMGPPPNMGGVAPPMPNNNNNAHQRNASFIPLYQHVNNENRARDRRDSAENTVPHQRNPSFIPTFQPMDERPAPPSESVPHHRNLSFIPTFQAENSVPLDGVSHQRNPSFIPTFHQHDNNGRQRLNSTSNTSIGSSRDVHQRNPSFIPTFQHDSNGRQRLNSSTSINSRHSQHRHHHRHASKASSHHNQHHLRASWLSSHSHADDWEFQERLRNDSRRSTESDDYSSSSSSGRGSGTDASSSYTDRTDNDAEAGKANKQRPVMPKQKSKRVKFASPEKKDTKFDNLMKRVASVLDRPLYRLDLDKQKEEELTKEMPCFHCPNCNTKQRDFINFATAAGVYDSPQGYLALYFVFYLVSSLCVFGFEEGWAPLDCVYFSVITLTTAGLGDFVPSSNGAKIVCTCFIYVGVATIGLLLGSLLAGSMDNAHIKEAREAQIRDCPNCLRLEKLRRRSMANFSTGDGCQELKENLSYTPSDGSTNNEDTENIGLDLFDTFEEMPKKAPGTALRLSAAQIHTRHMSIDIGGRMFGAASKPPMRRSGSGDCMPALDESTPFLGANTRQSNNDTRNSANLEMRSFDDSYSSSSTSTESSDANLSKPMTRVKAVKYTILTLNQALFNSLFIIAAGSVGFYYIEDMSAVDSFYFTTVLLTSVGYGDIVPVTTAGKIFTTIFVILASAFLLHNMTLISMIPLELRKRRIEAAVLGQFGNQINDDELRELSTGRLIHRLKLATDRPEGLEECTREMFSLAMLVRLGRITENDVKATFAAFRRLDIGNYGKLNSRTIIEGELMRRKSIKNLLALSPPDCEWVQPSPSPHYSMTSPPQGPHYSVTSPPQGPHYSVTSPPQGPNYGTADFMNMVHHGSPQPFRVHHGSPYPSNGSLMRKNSMDSAFSKGNSQQGMVSNASSFNYDEYERWACNFDHYSPHQPQGHGPGNTTAFTS